MARHALEGLGERGEPLLCSDRDNIWVAPGVPLEIDAERHEGALRAALAMSPGQARDDQLVMALADDAILLADEPYADWAMAPRDRLHGLRQRARLGLARDRAKGAGRTSPAAVIEAWEACLEHDPACEEAAAALVRMYESQGLRVLALRAYERCRDGLEEIGLRPSPALDELRARSLSPGAGRAASPAPSRDERRVVSVLFAEVMAVTGAPKEDPEDLRDLLGDALASAITAVEGLGGTVTSVSGAGLQALFGAPEAHEDDPERAVRAAFRALSTSIATGAPPLRIGVETGAAIVGLAPVEAGAGSYYRIVGAVVSAAAALQSVSNAGSVLVGPATRAATEGLFDWGPTEEVLLSKDVKPLVGAYLERPRARAPARQLRLGGRGPLVGREAELSTLITALRNTEEGKGSVVVLEGEPGLGKTRLVQECRKRFMAWVGARSGRLPLWAEGRCASYASTTPYSLYRHLLASWAGVAPDQPEAVVAPALERALVAVMGERELWPVIARMMDLAAGAELAPMGPADLQRATFAALRDIVGHLARAGPTVLVVEDLHWADATSLQLTVELAALALEGPLLLLLTRRPHPDSGVSAAEAAIAKALDSHMCKVTLARLAPMAEQELARVLVGENAGPGVVEAVRAGTEGNPLFLEERLFSMVEVGALVGGPGAWRLAEGAVPEVPLVLERMVRSRVDYLAPGAQAVVRAASVIGIEPSLTLLSATSDAAEELPAHLAELESVGLLGELPGAAEPTYRFRHALIQEAIYRGVLRAERRRLHGRVAWALESLSEGRLPEVAAVLGRHFAVAGEDERAVHYFGLAGDHAEAAYANEEAIASYRAALELVEAASTTYPAAVMHELWYKLAGPTERIGRRSDARHALQQALALVDASDTLTLVRVHDHLACNYSEDRRYDAADPHFEAAKKLLPRNPIGADQAVVDAWIKLMNGLSEQYRNQSLYSDELAVLEEMRPVVQARGTVRQRSNNLFLIAKAQAELARYRVTDQVIADMRLAVEMVPDRGQQEGDGW
ncbi:MAG TPA: AAA family ATPase, partial [Acidimicrobiales bacterium]|nr:AAA family ATPase [Acidimicrobiales bacterium]